MAKAKKKSKAKKSTAKPAKKKKSKKVVKRVAAKAPAKKKTKKATARKAAPAKAKKTVRKAVPKKKPAPKKKAKQIVGEGDYAATRAFDKDQTDFVKRNKARIPALAKEAEAALDGPEGDNLRAAEQEAMNRSIGD